MPKYGLVLPFLLLAVAIESATCRNIEKRAAKVDYFQNYVNQIEDIKKMPFIGQMAGPYIDIIQSLIDNVDHVSEGTLHTVVNSVMPCTFNGGVKCQGSLDKESAKKLAKSIMSNIPKEMLPPSVAGMLQLANDMM